MFYNNIHHTDAPYPWIKTFFDARERQTFVSPQRMEEDFFPGHRDTTTKQIVNSGLTENIPDNYLDRFSDFLTKIDEKIDFLVREQRRVGNRNYEHPMVSLYSDVVYVEFTFKGGNILLNWISVRPCAEGSGFYNVVLYWMIHCICKHEGLGLEIKDCLDANVKILEKKNFTIVSTPHDRHGGVIQHNAVASHDRCLAMNNVDFWNLRNKIREFENSIMLIPEQYPTATQMNDWGWVQNKFFNSKFYKSQIENEYMKQNQPLVVETRRPEAPMSEQEKQNSIQVETRRRDRWLADKKEKDKVKIQRKLDKIADKSANTSIFTPDEESIISASDFFKKEKVYSPAVSHKRSGSAKLVFPHERSPSPSVEDLVKSRSPSLENTQLRRSRRTPTPDTLRRKGIPDSELFESLTPEHETFDESDENHEREDDFV